MARTASILRTTSETNIKISVDLDGQGIVSAQTGVGFFDHMLNHLGKHSKINLSIVCQGDLHIDAHHTVEDCGLAIGQAIREALGNKHGITRYGYATIPMDETLVTVALDLSGRPAFSWHVKLENELLGNFSSQLGEEFFRALTNTLGINLHMILHHGRNTHHILEALFKATARALRQAIEIDPKGDSIPSTKGTL